MVSGEGAVLVPRAGPFSLAAGNIWRRATPGIAILVFAPSQRRAVLAPISEESFGTSRCAPRRVASALRLAARSSAGGRGRGRSGWHGGES